MEVGSSLGKVRSVAQAGWELKCADPLGVASQPP